MTSPPDQSPGPPPDWEAFYRDYRKPGYVEGFEILSKLGGGMFGHVYRARRLSIGKDYAIKFLKVDDGDVRRAVLSELEQVRHFAQIDHPNLVSIEDRGEVDGIPFLVMAFAGAETLRDRMPVGRAPTAGEKDELLRWFLQACRGLAALHERGLVHFDVKPANVFLKGGVARLGDYGLSKLVTHSRGSLSMGRGTPYYMAPELLQRRGDQRSDVYSLGVLLYEILCGRVPFTGDSEWEVLKQHESASPELPPHLTPAERRALQRCLAKDPAARFQDVRDLVAELGSGRTWAPATDAGVASTEAGTRDGRPAEPDPAPADGQRKESYEALARASREAVRHAGVVARHALRDAERVAHKAAGEVRRAWRDSLQKTRLYAARRWRVLSQLRTQRSDEESRAAVCKVAAAIARPPRRRGRWRRAAFVAVVLAFSGASVVAAFAASVRRVRGGDDAAAHTVAVSGPSLRAAAALFRTISMPADLTHLVSPGEPGWAVVAEFDRDAARRMLAEHIERLRAEAPIQPELRRERDRFPEFEERPGDARLLAAQRELQALLADPQLDRERAAAFAGRDAASLLACARRLRSLGWRTEPEVLVGERLHTMLQDATACRDLELVDGAPFDVEAAAANRRLGDLWTWFVNEFAHTERAWRTYRSLLSR